MEQNKIYPLLALTLIISVLISVGTVTLLKDKFIGPQGIQGEKGEPFSYEGKWVLTYDRYWSDTNLDQWTYTFTTKADFIIVQPIFLYEGDYPEYAFMSIRIYEGRDTLGKILSFWSSSWNYGGNSLMLIGKGTYTIEANTNDNSDIGIDIWEFLPTEVANQNVKNNSRALRLFSGF